MCASLFTISEVVFRHMIEVQIEVGTCKCPWFVYGNNFWRG